MPKIILMAKDVELSFINSDSSKKLALERLTLEILDGECLSIIGPSGCGKTSLLNLFGGFFPPTSGRLFFQGTGIAGPSADRGRIFQNSTLFPWRSVAGNITSGQMLSKLPKAEQDIAVKDLLKNLQLPDCSSLYPDELSGGMAQRVEIARALANRPLVLLADEPFSNLDHKTARLVRQWFNEVIRSFKLTVVFVTHNIEEAVFLGDRVAVMSPSPGRIAGIVEIPFPRPRLKHLFHSADFISIVTRVEELLS